MKRSAWILSALLFVSLRAQADQPFQLEGFSLETDVTTLRTSHPQSLHQFFVSGLPEPVYKFQSGQQKGFLPDPLTGTYQLKIIGEKQMSLISEIWFSVLNGKVESLKLKSPAGCDDIAHEAVNYFMAPRSTREYDKDDKPHTVKVWSWEDTSVELDCVYDLNQDLVDTVTIKFIGELPLTMPTPQPTASITQISSPTPSMSLTPATPYATPTPSPSPTPFMSATPVATSPTPAPTPTPPSTFVPSPNKVESEPQINNEPETDPLQTK